MSEQSTDMPERVVACMAGTGESLLYADGAFRLERSGKMTRSKVQLADAAGDLVWRSESERSWFRWIIFSQQAAVPAASPHPMTSVSATPRVFFDAAPATSTHPRIEKSSAYRLGTLIRSVRLGIRSHPVRSIIVVFVLQLLFSLWRMDAAATAAAPNGSFGAQVLTALGFLPVLISVVIGVSMAASRDRRRLVMMASGYALALFATRPWWSTGWGELTFEPGVLKLLLAALPVLTVSVTLWALSTSKALLPSRGVWGLSAGLAYFFGGLPDQVLERAGGGVAVTGTYLTAAALTAALVALLALPPRRSGV